MFLLVMIFNFISLVKSNQVIFPFKTELLSIESKYIEAITNNKIYITMEIGTPPQKINLYLTMDTSYLLIANSNINISYYNSGISKTYTNTSKLTDFYLDYLSKGYYANESFIFPSYDNTKQRFNNIEFIHVMEYSDDKYISSGYFGLKLPKQNKINIINLLKKENIISSYMFNLKYTSELEGYLSIGESPPEYNNKEDDSIRRANALPCDNDNSNLCWFLQFNDIKFGDIKVNRDRAATISPEIGFIVGTKEYQIKIDENYFGKILKDQCEKVLSENYYYYYKCDKNADISSFKELVFSHQEFMYDFVLTKDDLFKLYGDNLYFLIVFDMFSSYGKNWKLGKPFIKKYNFLYNQDDKAIYFYDNKDSKNSDNFNKKNSNLIYWIIIGCLGLLTLIMITFAASKFLFKPKRKKADELKEDFDYSTPDINNNNQDYNEDGLIINN